MTSGVLAPRYSVKFYREGVYELIRFKRALSPHLPPKREEGESIPEEKFSQAICRARSVIFQVAFCNDWDSSLLER